MADKMIVIIFSDRMKDIHQIHESLVETRYEIAGISASFENINFFLVQFAPEVLIISLEETWQDFHSLIYQLKIISPRTKILVLQNQCESARIVDVIRSGASEFLLENLDLDGLAPLLDSLMNEGGYLPKSVAESLLKNSHKEFQTQHDFSFKITGKEQIILELLSKGLSIEEIGINLSLSDQMIIAHISNILQKVQFADIIQKKYEDILVNYTPI